MLAAVGHSLACAEGRARASGPIPGILLTRDERRGIDGIDAGVGVDSVEALVSVGQGLVRCLARVATLPYKGRPTRRRKLLEFHVLLFSEATSSCSRMEVVLLG